MSAVTPSVPCGDVIIELRRYVSSSVVVVVVVLLTV
jgi:hypothetical protein